MPLRSTSLIDALMINGMSRFSRLQINFIIKNRKSCIKIDLNYFNTVGNFAPKRAPGFDVGTLLNDISAGMNPIKVFRVRASVIFIGLWTLTSFSHIRLNC